MKKKTTNCAIAVTTQTFFIASKQDLYLFEKKLKKNLLDGCISRDDEDAVASTAIDMAAVPEIYHHTIFILIFSFK